MNSVDCKLYPICNTPCRAGKDSKVFQLCRRDKTTINRHIERRHKKSSNIIIKSFYDNDERVKNARKCIESQSQVTPKQTKQGSTAVMAPPLQTTLHTNRSASSISSPSATKYASGSAKPKAITQSTLTLNPNSSTECEDTTQSKEYASLHAKIDTLINGFKDFKIKSCSQTKEGLRMPLSAVSSASAEEVSSLLVRWPEVKNVLDLVDVCKHVRFFAGDEEKGVLSVLRCETCFMFIRSKKGNATSMDPSNVARKGIGR